jgi:hypothetical protein
MTNYLTASPKEIIVGLRYIKNYSSNPVQWTGEVIEAAIDLITKTTPEPLLEIDKWLIIGDGVAHAEIYCSLQCCLEMLHHSGYFEAEGITTRTGAKAEIDNLRLNVDWCNVHDFIDGAQICDNSTKPSHFTRPELLTGTPKI